ncbi:MAG: hypothetical protein WCG78_02985 [Candidatus Omnitrophota bacterium]
MKSRRGSVLIAAIWVLNILAIFALYIAYSVNQGLLIVKRIESAEALRVIAEAGVKEALLELKTGGYTVPFSALGAASAQNPGVFRGMPINQGSFTVSYQSAGMAEAAPETAYGFRDEESKLNINTAPASALARLFTECAGLEGARAQKLAGALVDYRDADTVTNEGIAEDFVYETKGGYFLKNADLESLDELKLVPGMDAAIFAAVKEYVTVYGGGPVNINTAGSEVLAALGLEKALVDKIIVFRAGEDGILYTVDDRIVTDMKTAPATIAKAVHLIPGEKAQLEGAFLSGALSTKSSVVAICSDAVLARTHRGLRIECAYDVIKNKMLFWKETPRLN